MIICTTFELASRLDFMAALPYTFFERRKPNSFTPRRAVVIEIKAWVIDQDGKSAADQHHDKKKIEEMAITDPKRKPCGPAELLG